MDLEGLAGGGLDPLSVDIADVGLEKGGVFELFLSDVLFSVCIWTCNFRFDLWQGSPWAPLLMLDGTRTAIMWAMCSFGNGRS